MPKQIWIGTVELEYTAQDAPRRVKQAFTNITTWAEDYDEFCEKTEQMLEHYGWHLLGVQEAAPVHKNKEFGDEVRQMIERTRENHSAVIYGTFHSHRSG